jgi:hypothetical protein
MHVYMYILYTCACVYSSGTNVEHHLIIDFVICQLVPLLGPPEHHSGVPERTLSLVGNKQQLDTATELIKELLSEVYLK